jgi:hypothetical protein
MNKILNKCTKLLELRVEAIQGDELHIKTKKDLIKKTIEIEQININKIKEMCIYFEDIGFEDNFFEEIIIEVNKHIPTKIEYNSYLVYKQILLFLEKDYKKYLKSFIKAKKY